MPPAAAAWQPAAPVEPVKRIGLRVALLPVAFATVALGVLAHAGFGSGSRAAIVAVCHA